MKNIFTVLWILIFSQISFAQGDWRDIVEKNKNKPFVEIVEKIEHYYSTHYNGKGSGYKQFKRWEYLQYNSLDTNGMLQNHSKLVFDIYHSRANSTYLKSENNIQGNWISINKKETSYFGPYGEKGIGRVNCIVKKTGTDELYIGTPSGGLWKSPDDGESWKPLTDGLPQIGVSGIALKPNSSTIYISTGDCDNVETNFVGVMVSFDDGETWYSTGSFGTSTIRVYELKMHPLNFNILYCATSEGLFVTKNGGVSWSLVQEGWFYDIEFKPNNPNIMYACDANWQFFKSSDSGDSWSVTLVNNNEFTSSRPRSAIAVTIANPEVVYMAVAGTDPVRGKIVEYFKSIDSGSNLLSVSISTDNNKLVQYGYNFDLTGSSVNENVLFYGTFKIFRSVDGALTWENTYGLGDDWTNWTHVDIHGLEDFNGEIYTVHDGGVSKSLDQGTNWRFISDGVENQQIYRIGLDAVNNERLAYGSQDNGQHIIENNTDIHWYGGDGMETIIDFSNPQIIYAMWQMAGPEKSTDGGLTSKYVGPGSSGAWISPLSMHPTNSSILHLGFYDIWRTNDACVTWQNITGHSEVWNANGSSCTSMAVAPSDPNIVYASKTNNLYRTKDNGATWSLLLTNISYNRWGYYPIAIHSTNPNIVWYATASGSVFKTTDGGDTWVDISANLPPVGVNSIVLDNNATERVFVGTNCGVYYTDNTTNGAWVSFYNGLPNVRVMDLEINRNANKLVAGTYGRGVWTSDLPGDECALNYDLSGNINGFKTFYAENNITSTQKVGSFSDITYVAGDNITLYSGFEVSSSNVIEGVDQGNNQYNKSFHAVVTENPCSKPIIKSNIQVDPVSGIYLGTLEEYKENNNVSNLENISNDFFNVYPNPTTGLVAIDFIVNEKKSNVIINVKNIMGILIETVINNSEYERGKYTVTFDLGNNSSGVYFVNFQIGSFKITRSILIEK